jgi:hypothetical protein
MDRIVEENKKHHALTGRYFVEPLRLAPLPDGTLPVVTVSSPPGPVRTLTCCCCGGTARGRQWHNRDTGYGLCPNCIDRCEADVPVGHTTRSYGVRGIHYDVERKEVA